MEGRQRHGQVQVRAHETGEAVHGKAVGAVRGDADVEHFLVQFVGVHELFAGHDLAAGPVFLGQHENAGMIVGKTELSFGADHAEGGDAAQLGLLHDKAAGKRRAHGSHDDQLTGRHVGRAADVQMIGIGMRLAGEHAARDHALDFRVGMQHFFQFEAEHGEHYAQLSSRSRIRDKFLQPIETQQHMFFSSEDENIPVAPGNAPFQTRRSRTSFTPRMPERGRRDREKDVHALFRPHIPSSTQGTDGGSARRFRSSCAGR